MWSNSRWPRHFQVDLAPTSFPQPDVVSPLPVIGGSVHQHRADALQLQSDDEPLNVGCGSGSFLSRHARHVRRLDDLCVGLLTHQIDLMFIQLGLSEVMNRTKTIAPNLDRRYLAIFRDGSEPTAPSSPPPARSPRRRPMRR
jgi:hypothetical protein